METDKRLTGNVSHSYYPSVAVSGSVAQVVWQDDREGSWKIFHKFSSDNGITWEADTRLSNNTASHSVQPSVAVSGSAVHVVWKDNRDSNSEIYYKRNPTGGLTGINEVNWDIPNDFRLDQNYPNPINSVTEINYQLPIDSYVTLKIFDFIGRVVRTLVDENQNAGSYSVTFSEHNLPAGIYYYRLETDRYNQTKRMVLLK